jgi:hypothetical protein
MHDDYDPIPADQKGTVVDVAPHDKGTDAWIQIDVDWGQTVDRNEVLARCSNLVVDC